VLKFIRRNADAAWVKFMFVAIVVVFIFWGMGGIVGGEKAQIVARVNQDVIEPVDFVRTYNHLLRAYQEVLKDNFKPEMMKMLDLKQRALDQLIQASLLEHEAERIGLRVDESEVRDSIKSVASFQQDGGFDKELYIRVLRANNLTPGEFEESERRELLTRKLQDLITAGVHVSEAEVHDRFQIENDKVNLRFIKFDAPAFLSAVTVTDDEVQAYYDKNKETFREPERVRIEYAVYPADKFVEQVEVTDTEVQEYYDAHRSEYEKPERVHARHILFKVASDASPEAKEAARKHAEEILGRVKAGEDFAALAKQYSEDSSAEQGGDLGFFPRGQMVKSFEDVAFSLAPGATSEIVESPFGFHIIKVEAKEEAHTQSLDEARGQIVATLKHLKAQDVARTRAAADHDKIAGGMPLAAVAQAAGLTVATPPPFGQYEAISGIGTNPTLAKAALATHAGEVGPVVEAPPGSVVFRVIEHIDAHVPPLGEIRARVEDKVRSEHAQTLAKSKAEAALTQLQTHDIDSVAAADHLEVGETGPFTRSGTALPVIGNAPDLKRAAFQLTPEKPVAPAVYTVMGNNVVAVLKERIPADEEKFKTEKDSLMRQAEERRKQQTMEEFINYLKAHAAIDVSQDFLASITDTGRPLDGGPRRQR
jgi:peptidyl-prolyl cis-trans isomerase D